MTKIARIQANACNESDVFQLQIIGGDGTSSEVILKQNIEAIQAIEKVSIFPVTGSFIWNCYLIAGKIVTSDLVETIKRSVRLSGYTVAE